MSEKKKAKKAIKKSRKSAALGAMGDDPVKLADRAIKEADAAYEKEDTVGLREAAELGWLAISSTADVAAMKLGREPPGGASARRAALSDLEKAGKMRKGALIGPFEDARRDLHGQCFHEDRCPTEESFRFRLDTIKLATESAVTALKKLKKKR